jgi:hypothetical protein
LVKKPNSPASVLELDEVGVGLRHLWPFVVDNEPAGIVWDAGKWIINCDFAGFIVKAKNGTREPSAGASDKLYLQMLQIQCKTIGRGQ